MLLRFQNISSVSFTYTPAGGTPVTVQTAGAEGWDTPFKSFMDGNIQYYSTFWRSTQLTAPLSFTLAPGETATVDFVLNVSKHFVQSDHTLMDPATPVIDAHCTIVGV